MMNKIFQSTFIAKTRKAGKDSQVITVPKRLGTTVDTKYIFTIKPCEDQSEVGEVAKTEQEEQP